MTPQTETGRTAGDAVTDAAGLVASFGILMMVLAPFAIPGLVLAALALVPLLALALLAALVAAPVLAVRALMRRLAAGRIGHGAAPAMRRAESW